MMKLFFICSVSIIILGCGNSPIDWFHVKSSFDQPFPKREKNLSYILGNSFSIKQTRDTINYKILFNKNSKQNFIVNKDDGDTIFSGTVCKYRGLYYFNEQINDTSYWIYAVKIKDGKIKGLQTSLTQMLAWDNKFEFYPTNFKHKPSILKYIDTTNNLIRLTPIKKEMRIFYENIMDSLPAYTLINIKSPIIKELPINDTSKTNNSIGYKIYPNPAINDFTIDLNTVDYYEYTIFDISGHIIRSGGLTQQLNTIKIPYLKNGAYFIKIYNSEKEVSETQKLIVKK